MVNGGDVSGLNFGKGETKFQGVWRGAEAFVVFALEVQDKFGVIAAGENVLVVDGLPIRGPGSVIDGGENVVDKDGVVGSYSFRVRQAEMLTDSQVKVSNGSSSDPSSNLSSSPPIVLQ